MLSFIVPYLPSFIIVAFYLLLMTYVATKSLPLFAICFFFLGGILFRTQYLWPGLNTGDLLGLSMIFLFIITILKNSKSLSLVHTAVFLFFTYVFLNLLFFVEGTFVSRRITRMLFYLILPTSILLCCVRRKRDLEIILLALIPNGLIMFLFGIAVYMAVFGTGHSFIGNRLAESVPNISKMANSAWFYMAALSALVFMSKSERTKTKLIYFFLYMFFVFCVIMSGTRSTALALIVGSLLFFLVSSKTLQGRLRASIRLLSVIGISLLIMFQIGASTGTQVSLLHRSAGLFDRSEMNNVFWSSRGEIWSKVCDNFNLSLFGIGIDNWHGDAIERIHIGFSNQQGLIREYAFVQQNPENIFLMLVVETGLVGVVLFFFVLLLSIRNLFITARISSFKNNKEFRLLRAFTFALFFASILRAQFFGGLYGAVDLFIAIALSANLIRIDRSSKRHGNSACEVYAGDAQVCKTAMT